MENEFHVTNIGNKNTQSWFLSSKKYENIHLMESHKCLLHKEYIVNISWRHVS